MSRVKRSQKRRPPPLQAIRVQLDVLNTREARREFEAFSYGDSWDGWAVPYFEAHVADAIMHAFNLRFAQRGTGTIARYRADDDCYVFLDDDGEVEEYGAVQCSATKFYPIGARIWTWSEINDDAEGRST